MNELLTLTTGMPPETYTAHTTPILMWYGLFVVKKSSKKMPSVVVDLRTV